ncbi:unnamed protein product [Parnassius apollo]|uniref:(apollo) hypothetical protein n=1 Tax=Parnassius apollo TaxID=110799 RepID=A0A8S3WD93_PARAO|nr:unnamed protein product [Parnassius apollo]
MYGSDTNVSKMKDKHVILSEWVNPRKKRVYESEDELSTGQISAVQKPACCTENMLSSLKETMDSLREEMKIMMHTLKEMKDQQETRFGNFEKDMSDIKITKCQLQKTNEVVDDSLDYLGKKCSKLENAIEEANNEYWEKDGLVDDVLQQLVIDLGGEESSDSEIENEEEEDSLDHDIVPIIYSEDEF